MMIVNTSSMTRLAVRTAVCLGYFDGVHVGHLALLEQAKKAAREDQLTVAVHMLDRSAAEVIHPERKTVQLTTMAQKEKIFAENGCEILAVSTFDDRLRFMPGEVFFRTILLDRLNAGAVIAGDDHRFGYRGDTGAAELARLCDQAGVRCIIVPRIALPDGTVISSTAIRQAIRDGDLERASQMLGRPVQTMLTAREAGETR